MSIFFRITISSNLKEIIRDVNIGPLLKFTFAALSRNPDPPNKSHDNLINRSIRLIPDVKLSISRYIFYLTFSLLFT